MKKRQQRGSMIIAAVFFLMIFITVAGIGVDVSKYYYQKTVLQSIADGAALAGGNALNQYKNQPDEEEAYTAVVDYIRSAQGDTRANSYDMEKVYDSDLNDTIVKDVNGWIFVRGPFGSMAAQTSGQGGQGLNFTQSGDMKFISGNNGEVKSPPPSNVKALGSGSVDLDGDQRSEVPYLLDSTTLKYRDNEGNEETINLPAGKQADLQKTLMAVGSWNGSDPAIYYTGDNHEKIYRVKKGGNPTEVAHADNGVNAVSGFGDIDGDGSNELVFADGSQDPRYVEQSDPTQNVFSRLQKGAVGTPGSNNGIGYGAPVDFDGDGTDEVPVVGGGNGVALITENSDEYLGGGSGCGCARKSPVAITNVDDDSDLEVAYQNMNNDQIRYYDDDESQKTLMDDQGNPVIADDDRGLVAGVHSGSSPHYKVAVAVFDRFNPTFMPQEIFGNKDSTIHAVAASKAQSKTGAKIESSSADCGIYLKQKLEVQGQFNKIISDGSVTDDDVSVCGSKGSAEVQLHHSNSEFGEFHLSDCSSSRFQDGGATHGGCSEDAQSDRPQLQSKYQNTPAPYDINVNFGHNQTSWSKGGCKGGNHQVEQTDGDKVWWYDGNTKKEPVCVQKGASDFKPGGKNGKKQNKDYTIKAEGVSGPEKANIYIPNGNITWRGNKSNMYGNLVTQKGNIDIRGNKHKFEGSLIAGLTNSTYNITVNKNNNVFDGREGTKGISMWASGGIQFHMNGSEIYGFLGTRNGNIEFKSSGGGDMDINGMMSSGQHVAWNPNNTSTFDYDPSMYDESILSFGKWVDRSQSTVNRPLFSNVSVNLIK